MFKKSNKLVVQPQLSISSNLFVFVSFFKLYRFLFQIKINWVMWTYKHIIIRECFVNKNSRLQILRSLLKEKRLMRRRKNLPPRAGSKSCVENSADYLLPIVKVTQSKHRQNDRVSNRIGSTTSRFWLLYFFLLFYFRARKKLLRNLLANNRPGNPIVLFRPKNFTCYFFP